MSTQVQYRRGTAAQNDAFLGALAEITVDTTNWVLRVADGTTTGGYSLVGLNATQTLTNKIYNGTSVSVSGNVTASGNVSGTYLLGNASLVTGLSASKIFNGTTEANIGTSGGNANITVGGTSNVVVYASTGEFVTGLQSVTGNITGGNITTAGIITVNSGGAATAIVNGASNAVGNIGSATTYFNTVFAKATSAQYADVAEKYVSDHAYPPGTVLEFGGEKEVTVAATSHSTGIAGVVSTNPAYLMNAGATGDAVVEVALLGRVPCNVVGPIVKGDRLVSSQIPGVAQALNSALYQPGCIIGKALENYNSDQVGTIEVVVGRV